MLPPALTAPPSPRPALSFITSSTFIPRFAVSNCHHSASQSRHPTTHRSRSRRRLPLTCSNASPFDDDFFLPLDDLTLLKNNNINADRPSASAPQTRSVAHRRTEAKRLELSRAAARKQEDDDETRRAQLVDEKLSAADLFGIVEPTVVPGPVASPQAPSAEDPHRKKWAPKQADVILGPEPARKADDRVRKRAMAHSVAKSPSAKPSKRADPASVQRKPKKDFPPLPETDSTVRPGDLVIHSRHGIGRFRGIERTVSRASQPTPGAPRPLQEFAVIEYRDGDVYVPFSHFEIIRRLTEQELKLVDRLDTISGSATYPGMSVNTRARRSKHLARKRTREKIRKQLVNLHGLYAERTTITRDPFPIDADAERNFIAQCKFVLTDDQTSATTQVMKDMSENHRPMDRLLCGDVGFGKTEVAIRAAFRVLAAGKQVAILAPTTILAQQHYETFRERFDDASVDFTIACLTRFAPRKQNVQNREMIGTGDIRIAIGTHMLLSDSCVFPNLGLLIVDEEHRFGVNQKEKIRSRYRGIDTLFLSATPIPRTLHLALSGLRDTSVLRTPPVGRKPVITKVSPCGSGVVRAAISREVERDGQVFFVVPRIEGIEATANWIRDLFPNLKVLVAHGSVNDLERRIWSFAQKEYDVLVCTTIIENGINMPDVNTVIVQDAGKFGLAQLHQLRGRVGRCDIQAYSYMLYSQTGASQSVQTLDRLRALELYSDLGSGFAIAQRDMEMRGVGTILGVEQHGNTSVGADEYAKMLSEELEHARTGKPIPIALPNAVQSTEVYLPVASLIPSEYILDLDQKMTAYGYLSSAKSCDALGRVVDDLELRYGPLPSAARRHVSVLELKLFAKPLGISRIFTERQHVILDWPLEEPAFNRLVAFLPDKQSRTRCEHVVGEERVVIRGLGICTGDVQLAKLRWYLGYFSKAASGLLHQKDRKQPDPNKLVDSLSQIEAEKQ